MAAGIIRIGLIQWNVQLPAQQRRVKATPVPGDQKLIGKNIIAEIFQIPPPDIGAHALAVIQGNGGDMGVFAQAVGFYIHIGGGMPEMGKQPPLPGRGQTRAKPGRVAGGQTGPGFQKQSPQSARPRQTAGQHPGQGVIPGEYAALVQFAFKGRANAGQMYKGAGQHGRRKLFSLRPGSAGFNPIQTFRLRVFPFPPGKSLGKAGVPDKKVQSNPIGYGQAQGLVNRQGQAQGFK